jgi:hypothetical protein
MVSKRSVKRGYKESPSSGEEALTPLLAFAACSSSDVPSDILSDILEAKLDLPDAKLSTLALLGTPLLSLASPISFLIPLKLNLL